MDHIDKVYYINLDHRTDRNEQFLSWIQESSFPESKVERVSAVHTPGRGHIGCILSHLKVLETFLASSHKNCIIFEDDFVPLHIATFWDNFQRFFSSNLLYDVVMGSYNVEKVTDAPVPFLKRIHSAYTTSSYLITKEYASKLFQFLKDLPRLALEEEAITMRKTHQYTLDVYWCNLMAEDTWYCFYPRIGKQEMSYSDIEQCYVNHNV